MSTKNEALIARVREALKYDLNELNAVFTPLLNDVIAELTNPGAVTVPAPSGEPVFIMGKTELVEGDGYLTEDEAIADALTWMGENPLACIADAFVYGDEETFKVRDIVEITEEGVYVLGTVGWCSIVVILKVLMLHINRVSSCPLGACFIDRPDKYGAGFYRNPTPAELDIIRAFLQP